MKFDDGVRTVEVKPVCKQCQVDYQSPFQFESGVVAEEGGIWGHQFF
ncbi:hypothetical protein I3W98_38060 [Streptomyces cavourensis]|nr:hypothetical protein [Streptomyces cavourensis]